MKHFLTISFLAAIITTQAHADFPKRIMNCEVTDQVILHSDEGKPKRYTNFIGKFETGDTLRFELNSSLENWLHAQLTDPKRQNYVIGTDPDMKYKEFMRDSRGYLFDTEYNDRFSRDHIILNSGLRRLELKRYHKSDFHGILITRTFSRLLARVSTLDCKMAIDEFEEILAAFPEQ